MSIRTILVYDEKLATQGMELRLAPFEDVEIVATCLNGREAIRKIKTLKPDLVFLDIQMPGFDGFSVVQGVMDIDPPLFVFVTAYGDHAIRAFEAQAVDYLMKPVDQDRLADTMDRVRCRLADRRTAGACSTCRLCPIGWTRSRASRRTRLRHRNHTGVGEGPVESQHVAAGDVGQRRGANQGRARFGTRRDGEGSRHAQG